MSFYLASYAESGKVRSAIVAGDQWVDLANAVGDRDAASLLDVIERWNVLAGPIQMAARDLAAGRRGDALSLSEVPLLAPLDRPGQLYCAGANYYDHVAEMSADGGFTPPATRESGAWPWHFIKATRSAIVGPHHDVPVPSFSAMVDWEIELAAVIGRTARHVSVEAALDHVFGYTIANDISARDAVRRDATPPTSPFHFDWISGKSFDSSCPMGPWIVPADAMGDPQALSLRLWVNDVLKQDSSTAQMIFSIAEQIAALSTRITLYPGDVILTGTPAGCGVARGEFLQAGDKLRLTIEKIGTLEHRMVAP